MSFTKASFKVHSFFQQYITTPYLVDINEKCLVTNSKFSSRSNEKLVFNLAIAVNVLLLPTYFINFANDLISGINNPINLRLDQMSYFALNVGFISFTNASNLMIFTEHHNIIQMISEMCRLGNGINATTNLKIGKLKLKEVFIYSLYGSVLIMFLACGLTPFVIEWEPMQRAFGTSFGVKLLAAGIYEISSIYNGTFLASTFLLIFTFLENAESYTKRFLGPQKYFNVGMFGLSCKKFRMYQTIAIIVNSIYSDFLTFLISVGVLAASVSTFVTLTMWNSLSFVMYMVAPAFTFSRYMIVMLIIPYASIPNTNVSIFFDFWRRQVLKRNDRKILRSCPTVVGFNVGPYGVVIAKLGIRICDYITQNAISLRLL